MPSFLTSYLTQLKSKAQSWEHTERLDIHREWIKEGAGTGYLRLRIQMRNGDLLECSEFFSQRGEGVVTEGYNFHWQNPNGLLINRWDNAPHHPELNGFPDHVHNASEDNVISGLTGINLARVLDLISQQLVTEKQNKGGRG